MSVGLVLEGGGMRGAYTAGVLEAFADHKIAFPYVIGVSAGALNATAFVSGQPGRTRRVLVDYCQDPRLLSVQNMMIDVYKRQGDGRGHSSAQLSVAGDFGDCGHLRGFVRPVGGGPEA